MFARSESAGDMREQILHVVARRKKGCSVDELAGSVGISRSGVRQHLTVLERDGLVARGSQRPSGGRPQLQYVLTEIGRERFPRQYSWFAELLLEMLSGDLGHDELGDRLDAVGRSVGASLATGTGGAAPVEGVVARMVELGYDAAATRAGTGDVIEASNCVFHKLAEKRPEICRFDIAMLEAATGKEVEQCACMVRGDDICRFRLKSAD